MNLNDFEKHIDSVIIERGFDYYEDGYVTEITELKKNVWSAVVEGTGIYRVKVSINSGRIISSKCSCPFDMGPVCKHEVAVYYTIRDGASDDKGETSKRETSESKLKKNLDRLTKEELISIITEHALDNNKFYNYLIAHYEVSEKTESKTWYKKYLKSYINNAKDRHGFINYRNASEAAEGAFQLITDADIAIKKKQYEKAVYMAQAVIEEMAHSLEYTDDSDGEAGSAIEDAFEILFSVTNVKMPEKIRKELFAYSLEESGKKFYNDYGSWQDDFVKLAVLASSSEDDLRRVLQAVENNIKAESDSKYSSSYRIQELSVVKYDLLVKMKRGDEAEKFFKACLHFSKFRRRALEKAFKKKEYDNVIELAVDGEKKDTAENKPGLVREWKEWRYKIYILKKDYEGIRKLSYDFLLNYKDFKYYDMYKKTSDRDSWEDTYEKLKEELKKKSGNSFPMLLADILVKENELPVLLDMLKNHPQNVSLYQKHFLKTNSEDIYKLHLINIRDEAKRADNRKSYRHVCGSIKDLKKIGGKEQSIKIINELKEIYKNRPAFLDELSKI